MSEELELELTYLLKYIPNGLHLSEHKEVLDIYIPKSSPHPKLRIRKSGDKLMITKKEPTDGKDSSVQLEHTIPLTKEEFAVLSKLQGKRVRKERYLYNYNGMIAEIDMFQDRLEGLVLVDFEFKNMDQKAVFKIPDFCLADVTHEKFAAGGMLCGKSYSEIEGNLLKYGYKKLDFNRTK